MLFVKSIGNLLCSKKCLGVEDYYITFSPGEDASP